MHAISTFALARIAITVIGAILLVLSTFLTRPWPYAAWVKAAFWMLGLAGITWGVSRTILLLNGQSLSRRTYHFLDFQQPFMLGVAFALLALFFIGGEASRGMQRWRELKKKS